MNKVFAIVWLVVGIVNMVFGVANSNSYQVSCSMLCFALTTTNLEIYLLEKKNGK